MPVVAHARAGSAYVFSRNVTGLAEIERFNKPEKRDQMKESREVEREFKESAWREDKKPCDAEWAREKVRVCGTRVMDALCT